MVAEVFGAVSGFKGMLDLAKSLKDMNDATVRNTAVIELQGQILAAQEQQAALAEKVRTLEKEMARFETWDAESQKYELRQIGHGAFAHILKPDARGAQPPHWVCTPCFGKHQISVVQFARTSGGRFEWFCPSCKTQIYPFNNDPVKWPD